MKQAIVKFPSVNSYSELKNLKGYIIFTQHFKNEVFVHVQLEGLPEGIHGFHIHEHKITADIIKKLNNGIKIKNVCNTLGGHFNPYNSNHGSYRLNTERHAGDLINNLFIDKSGKIKISFSDPLISLDKNDINCILNRSIVIHETHDDEGILGLNALKNKKKLNKNEEESLKTGNAGKRIACGNIILLE